jgi:RNase P/RNase MRP subunit p29
MMLRKARAALVAHLILPAAAALFFASCGYHVAGRGSRLPTAVKTIAVPAFQNSTMRYKLSDQLTAAIARELIERTRYTVVADPNEADAVLTGAVLNFAAYPTVIDTATSRATGMLALVNLQVNLTERASGKLLFSRPAWEVRERYEISADPATYFEESGAAMERLSRDVARSVVSAILEDF